MIPESLATRSFPTAEIRRLLLVPTVYVGIAGLAAALTLASNRSLLADIFYYQYLAQEFAGSVALMALAAVAVLLAKKLDAERVAGIVEAVAQHRWWLALAVVVGFSVAALTVYHNHPLAMDEYSQSFQAEIFAEGKLWVDYPSELVFRIIPEKFDGIFFEAKTGRVTTHYWPGFSLLLAPFARIGAPWLLNPLLAAGSLLLLAHLARKLLPETLAQGWAILFALASPQFAVTAISYYSMTAHLFLNLLFVALLLEPTAKRLILAGFVGSLALVLHQPLPHAAFAAPWILWLATVRDTGLRHALPGRWRRLALLVLGYLPLSLVLGVGWSLLQWQIRHAEMDVAVAVASRQVTVQTVNHSLSLIGLTRWPPLEILSYRALEYIKLFLWAVPGLPLLAAFSWSRTRQTMGLRLLWWSAACSILAFFLVPFSQGHGWGSRYFHQAWGTLPLLAAAWLVSSKPSARGPWIRVMGALVALSLVAGTTLRFHQVDAFIDRHLSQRASLPETARLISFMALDRGFYREDLIQNDPFLRDPVVTLVSFGRQEDLNLVRRLRLRATLVFDNGADTIWLIEPDSKSGPLLGPLAPSP